MRKYLEPTEIDTLARQLNQLEQEDYEALIERLTTATRQSWLANIVQEVTPEQMSQILCDDAPATWHHIRKDGTE